MSNRLPQVDAFLSDSPKKMLIGGQWVAAVDGDTFKTLDPGTGKPLCEVASGKAQDVDLAVEAAQKAFDTSGWATMEPSRRNSIIRKFADLIEKHLEVLAQIESLDVGKPLPQAQGGDIPNVSQTLRYYADLADKLALEQSLKVDGVEAEVTRVPYGVCAFIFPWNFPALLVGWGISPALAAGNTVVIKPAEDTPLSTLYLASLAAEAGIPDGVINVVTGLGETAGAALAAHSGIKRMSFTGSPEVGRLIAEACGRNLVPVKLELGGKGAAVVFDDVDVKDVASKLAGAITLNTGQVCCTATRWLIHENIWDKFVDEVTSQLSQVHIGHGLASDTQMGPVVSEKQRKRVLSYLERGRREGATMLLDGGAAEVKGCEEGFYVKPALLTGSPNNVCAREEIFGPVAYVMKFKDEKEAVDLVNSSDYGLANSVWTGDSARAARVARSVVAGNSWINAHNVFVHGVPYAGVNRSGMGGGVLGAETLMDYLRPKSIVRPLAAV